MCSKYNRYNQYDMSNQIIKLCKRLIPEAKKSKMPFMHASGIVENGKIIGYSHNSNIRSRLHGINMPSIHAEISALSSYMRLKKLYREKPCWVLWNQR